MNSKLLGILLVAASLGSGCVVYDNSSGYYGPTTSGNVTFSWSFGSGLSCSTSNVSYVVVNIPGETLQNSGQFPCTTNGYPGITLNDFAPGDYNYTLDAYDQANTLLFTQSGAFTVNGDVSLNVQLDPAGGANSYAFLNWSFQAAANAPQCGVDFTQVVATFDGDPNTATTYNCADGTGGQPVATNYVAAGSHMLELDAMNGNGFVYASRSAPITTVTGAPSSQSFQLNWVVGGVAVGWTFFDASHTGGTTDCSAVGVDTMNANFQRASDGFLLYGSAGDSFACAGANPSVYNALPAGNYNVILAGTGPGPVLYSESRNYPITIQPGVFVAGGQAMNIELDKH
jgi:hypothetical protein